MKVVLRYVKYGMARFLSPLETSKAIERNLRRAKIPLLFSQGFHPAPLISYLDSISTGVVVRALYLTVHVEHWKEEMMERLKETSLKGLRPENFWIFDGDINTLADSYSFSILLEKEFVDEKKLSADLVIRKGKKRKEYKLREILDDMKVTHLKRFMLLKYTLKRDKLFSPWEIVKGVATGEGLFIPICEEVYSRGKPLSEILEGMING